MGALEAHIMSSLNMKDIRPGTRRTYVEATKRFWSMDYDSLNVADLNEVLYSIENQNTRRKTVIALKACLDHPAIQALRVPESIPRQYDLPSEDTLRLALMTCPHETRALLMMYCGLRLGEALAVTKDSLRGHMLMVEKQQTEKRSLSPVKTSVDQVPVPDFLEPLVAVLEPCTVSHAAVRKALSNAGNRVGVHLNPHMLRHWYCTMLIHRGVPPHVVQRLMRHKNLRQTLNVYAQVQKADLYDVVKDLGTMT